ncbi:hypothetical protein VI817_005927 [Penicillium citrinum]|nr:hypothetical protein VI817_005927 [Penicillium citrinum]
MGASSAERGQYSSCSTDIYTYDHRVWKTGLPVRSAVLKPHAGRLVVWWVTTCESLLLYVFYVLLLNFHFAINTAKDWVENLVLEGMGRIFKRPAPFSAFMVIFILTSRLQTRSRC